MNFLQSSALKCAFAGLAAVIVGCGPQDGSKELVAAREALTAGEAKKAEKLLLKAEGASNASPTVKLDAALYLAELMLREGKLSNAKAYITKAEGLAGDALDVRLLGAQIAWHMKDYSRAEKLFRGVAEDVKLPAEARSQGYAGLGIVEATCDEHEFARLHYIQAIRLDRRNASAWYHLGHLYRYAPFNYAEAALDHFEFFTRLEEDASPRVQKTQRVIIPAVKEMIQSQTVERLGSAKRDSAMAATLLAKAEAAVKKGALKTARQNYSEAVKVDPLSYPAALGFARILNKTDASAEGKDRALRHYRFACALRPSAVSTCLEAGRIAEDMRFYAQAREFYSRAIAANPASLDAIDGFIRALRKTGGNQKLATAYQAYRDTLPKGKRK